MCLTPFTIKNPKKARRNPEQELYINVPCGKCTACLKRRAASWVFRLKEQEKICKTAAFITYTYTDGNLPKSELGLPTLDRTHHTKYMKRLRKRLHKEGFKDKLKYYLVGEYGGKTERPHYHSIMFNLPQYYINNPHRLEEIWQNGIIQIDEVSGASIAYVCGYVNKQKHFLNYGDQDDRTPEFNFMSKGLGKSYLTKAQEKSLKEKLNPYITTEGGFKLSLPRYYKEKVFTDEEKQIIQDKAIEHIENNSTFDTEQQKINYIKHVSKQRKKNARDRDQI